MNTIFLALHVAGALATAGVALGTVWSLLFKKDTIYSLLAQSLGVAALVQSVTGSLLAFTSQSGTLQTFCVRIGAYLGVILLLEIILLVRILKKDQNYSISFVGSTVISSVVLASAAAFFIY